MADYKAMYLSLFNAVTDAIGILTAAQQHAEKLFIESDEAVVLSVMEAEKGQKKEKDTPFKNKSMT